MIREDSLFTNTLYVDLYLQEKTNVTLPPSIKQHEHKLVLHTLMWAVLLNVVLKYGNSFNFQALLIKFRFVQTGNLLMKAQIIWDRYDLKVLNHTKVRWFHNFSPFHRIPWKIRLHKLWFNSPIYFFHSRTMNYTEQERTFLFH